MFRILIRLVFSLVRNHLDKGFSSWKFNISKLIINLEYVVITVVINYFIFIDSLFKVVKGLNHNRL